MRRCSDETTPQSCELQRTAPLRPSCLRQHGQSHSVPEMPLSAALSPNIPTGTTPSFATDVLQAEVVPTSALACRSVTTALRRLLWRLPTPASNASWHGTAVPLTVTLTASTAREAPPVACPGLPCCPSGQCLPLGLP